MKAIVRQHVERIDGVAGTWFEWSMEGDSDFVKTLVVQVDFDTDPNSPDFRQNVLDAIADTATNILKDETTMVVSRLKIIPAPPDA